MGRSFAIVRQLRNKQTSDWTCRSTVSIVLALKQICRTAPVEKTTSPQNAINPPDTDLVNASADVSFTHTDTTNKHSPLR
ncbi:hypothetical protein F2P81_004149 [Scophthalmus maximus]|uniref:Uncharacterized protein n=1 Tax=Scophthalmus maximus TaxID=52904 RepID=A0A6A4TLD8_SCOMX|nr:hypothetical protein F2P81_004149 [Scophthalmus maximus]